MTVDILERAKDAAENIDHYAYDCDFEEARLVILALIPEVERLRSPEISGDLKKKIRMIRHCLHNPHSKQQGIDAFNAAGELARLLAAKDARIKELEEMIRQLGSLAFMGDMPLDQIVAHFIAWGQSNYDYTSRLEVAFLRSNAAMRYYQEGNRGPWPQLGEKFKEPYQEKAREELERIRNGE